MAGLVPQWQQINPNFSNSSKTFNSANSFLSTSGNIFSQAADYFQKENYIIQKEREFIAQERDKAFANIGKELSNKALQESIEATVLPDGSVRHTFNANNFQKAITKLSQEQGLQNYDPEDQARIWANMTINTDYQLGLSNNQANAQNALDRERLALERKRLGQHEKKIGDDYFNDFMDNYIGTLLYTGRTNINKTKELYNSLIETKKHATNPTQLAILNQAEKDINNPTELASLLKNLSDTDAISVLGSRYNYSLDRLNNNPYAQILVTQEAAKKSRQLLIENINNGSMVNRAIQQVNKDRKITTNLSDNDINTLSTFLNIIADYRVANNDKLTTKDIEQQMYDMVYNAVNTKKDENDNTTATLKLDFNKVINAVLRGNYDSKISGMLGNPTDEEKTKLTEFFRNKLGTNFYDDNKNSDNTTISTSTKAITKQEAISNTSNKYNFTLNKEQENNIFYNDVLSNADNNKLSGIFNINSKQYKENTIKADLYFKQNKGRIRNLSTADLSSFINQNIEQADKDNNINSKIAMMTLLNSNEYKQYNELVKQAKIAVNNQDTTKAYSLTNEINQYEQMFKNAYYSLLDNMNEARDNRVKQDMYDKQNIELLKGQLYGE